MGIAVEGRYRTHQQPRGLAAELRARGHRVRLIDLDSAAIDLGDAGWCADLGVLVCRGRSAAALALLAAAEQRGVPCINTPGAIAGVLNKAALGARLSAAGIPAPVTLLGSPRELASHPAALPPLILKPICGDNANGLRIVWNRQQLRDIHWPEGVAIAQWFVRTDGTDLKLYGAGSRVWAVRKPSPISETDGSPVRRDGAAGTEVALTAELAELAQHCKEVTGLQLYGVDCVTTPDGPLVIEVNDYPNYTGIKAVDGALADLVLSTVRV